MVFINYLCTEGELLDRLTKEGEEAIQSLLPFVEHASSFLIGRRGLRGHYIPWTQIKYFDGQENDTLKSGDLLTVTELDYEGNMIDEGIDEDFYLIGEDINTPFMGNGSYARIRKVSGVWALDRANVKITGTWGRWDETEVLPSESITLNDSAVTIEVSNGNLFSPGLHCLIESEQIVVTAIDPTVVAATSLNDGAITATDEIITVDDASEFSTGEVFQINVEDFQIIRINTVTNELAVLRGFNKTLATTHLDDQAIGVYRKFTIKRGINGTTAAAHAGTAISRYNTPGDVRELALAVAGKAYKVAKTQYTGREANANLGEAFYYKMIPAKEIMEVRKNWTPVVI